MGQSKEMDDNDAPPQEPEKDSFDVFGKMLSSMPAKPADEEEEGGEVKMRMVRRRKRTPMRKTRIVRIKKIPLTKCLTQKNQKMIMKIMMTKKILLKKCLNQTANQKQKKMKRKKTTKMKKTLNLPKGLPILHLTNSGIALHCLSKV